MKHLVCSAGLLLAMLLGAAAQTPEDQYLQIFGVIQNADTMDSAGRASEARTRYQEAQTSLQRLQRTYPTWNPKVVGYRLNYLHLKLATLQTNAPPVATPSLAPASPGPAVVPAAPPAKPAETAELERQLAELRETNRQMRENVEQLKGDKTLLEAKLKEALSTQPAAVDPRELTAAREQLRDALKENELLKATAAQVPAATTAEKRALEDARRALAEANQLAEARGDELKRINAERDTLETRVKTFAATTEALAAVRQENVLLQQQLKDARTNPTPDPETVRQLQETRDALTEANRKLDTQAGQVKNLTAERETLQQQLKALAESPAAIEALRAENEIIKKQLVDAKAAAAQNPDAVKQLAEAQTQLTALQTETDVLRLEKTALENRVKTLQAQSSTPPQVVAAPADLEKIKKLEAERDEYARKLTAATQELSSRRSRAANSRIESLNKQIETLQARVQVFEARAVPYSTEELALFQKPAPQLAAKPDPRASRKPISQLPSGVTELVVSAQRHFNAREYDKAEEDYREILRRDEDNALTLANLAAIQLERGSLDDADQNVTKAVAAAPEDVYALTILGQVKFRQEKLDDSLDAFSRAAKLKPDSAELQNYLGVVLGHKGLRDAAEKALRRAVVLNPGYADAHYNLAVFYGTKETSFASLARWHYQRATAGGHARNLELEKLFESKGAGGEVK